MRSNQSRGTKADKEPAVEATSAGGDPIRRHLMYISSRSTCSGREWKRQEEGKALRDGHCPTARRAAILEYLGSPPLGRPTPEFTISDQ